MSEDRINYISNGGTEYINKGGMKSRQGSHMRCGGQVGKDRCNDGVREGL